MKLITKEVQKKLDDNMKIVEEDRQPVVKFFGGGGIPGAVVSILATGTTIVQGRKLGRILTNPQALKIATRALKIDLTDAQRQTLMLRLARIIPEGPEDQGIIGKVLRPAAGAGAAAGSGTALNQLEKLASGAGLSGARAPTTALIGNRAGAPRGLGNFAIAEAIEEIPGIARFLARKAAQAQLTPEQREALREDAAGEP